MKATHAEPIARSHRSWRFVQHQAGRFYPRLHGPELHRPELHRPELHRPELHRPRPRYRP
jgi:hypothetical protein